MDDETDSNRRKIVLHPRTAAARRVDRSRSYGSSVRGFTIENEDVFVLVDAQRRSSVRHLVAMFAPVLLLLVSFVFAPQLTDHSLRGIPLPWLLLGPVTLFSIVGVAWRHDRKSLSAERSWATSHKDDDR